MVLQRIIMVQMEAPVSIWFYKESQGIDRDSIVDVVLQGIILV
jgi:hypothetical protein